MILKAWRYGLAAAVAVALRLLSLASGSEPWAQGQQECTVTVQPGESIQKAIDGAQEGAVICLAAGAWEENLKIEKNLTLRGEGSKPEEVQILGAKEGYPLVRIESEIEVALENLTLTKAVGEYCAEYEPKSICPEGLQALGKARVIMKNIQVSGNGGHGLWIRDSVKATLQESTIQKNGTSPDCAKPDRMCNGLMGMDKAVVEMRASRIRNNSDWGVVAALKQCGYDYDYFAGQVVFEGNNTIEGNNTSGNQNGMGNPGNHPWNRPDIPNGQVCLP